MTRIIPIDARRSAPAQPWSEAKWSEASDKLARLVAGEKAAWAAYLKSDEVA